jgi:hypothetical protein
MTGTDYNVALMMFFIPYVLFEVPSNILLAKFKKPSQYMGILVLCWGSIMTLMGVFRTLGAYVQRASFLAYVKRASFQGRFIWSVSGTRPIERSFAWRCSTARVRLRGLFLGCLLQLSLR